MSEPAEEQPDPETIQRFQRHESGGVQDDSQSPFSLAEPATTKPAPATTTQLQPQP